MSLFSWLRPASPVVPHDLQQRLTKLPAIGELRECSLLRCRRVLAQFRVGFGSQAQRFGGR